MNIERPKDQPVVLVKWDEYTKWVLLFSALRQIGMMEFLVGLIDDFRLMISEC